MDSRRRIVDDGFLDDADLRNESLRNTEDLQWLFPADHDNVTIKSRP